MDTDDLTATVREARAERDQADRERDVAVRGLRDAHTALLEIERLAKPQTGSTAFAMILSEAQGAIRAVDPLDMRGAAQRALDRQVEGMLAVASASMSDACTIRDTTTDQSKVRNHPDDPTQAEREEFWQSPQVSATYWIPGGHATPGDPGPVTTFTHVVNGAEPSPWPLTPPSTACGCGRPPSNPCSVCASGPGEPFTWVVFEVDGPRWHELGRYPAPDASSAIDAAADDLKTGMFVLAERTCIAIPVESLSPEYVVTTNTTTDTHVTVAPKEQTP